MSAVRTLSAASSRGAPRVAPKASAPQERDRRPVGRPSGTSIFDRDPVLAAATSELIADGVLNVTKIIAALKWVDGIAELPSASSVRHFVAKHHAHKARAMTTPAKADIAAALRLASNAALLGELERRLSKVGGAK